MQNDIYKQTLLAHYKAPKNVGSIKDADYITEGFNANCGDKVQLGIDIADSHISNIRYQIRACAICTASTSMMSEALNGQSVENARFQISQLQAAVSSQGDWPTGLEALSGAAESINRHKCVRLSWDACEDLLAQVDAPALQKVKN